jgi:hypothetical protein
MPFGGFAEGLSTSTTTHSRWTSPIEALQNKIDTRSF